MALQTYLKHPKLQNGACSWTRQNYVVLARKILTRSFSIGSSENILDERIAFIRRTKSYWQSLRSGYGKRMRVEPWKSRGQSTGIGTEQRKSTGRKLADPHPIKIIVAFDWIIVKYRTGEPNALHPFPGLAECQWVFPCRGDWPGGWTGCREWRRLDRRCRRVRRELAWAT